ncbi:DarT ssDNA thymidine ADP-ribosyltransferase family protein [Vibrio coralliirubri]|uniref:DarT ssDNA thymidine ADP-ribosyltransferase family protein n=1 Tax=Vibrio coralliirubri TaxID=1516159 RepID=UPI000A364217|nr:DarT ssDNA thymidine ADP-ribosyltransferase family protein [Vibrio coralliirubri]
MNEFDNSISSKDITEVLHFTTNRGLLGTLRTGGVLPNNELKQEDTLAFIFKQNSKERKERDRRWLNYVNLSLTKLNFEFFDYSKFIHQNVDMYWAILSFSPEILTHSDVYFTTTNNIYPSCIRGVGREGFEQMFNDPVEGKFQKKISRDKSLLPSMTTCEQAEVLYPGKLETKYLNKIYVATEEDKSSVMAQMMALSTSAQVEIAPNKFVR